MRRYAWSDIVISVVYGCLGSPVPAQLERKQVADRSSGNLFLRSLHGGCTNMPIGVGMKLSYAAKSPHSTQCVIFNLNYIADRGCNVYGSASLLVVGVLRLSQAE